MSEVNPFRAVTDTQSFRVPNPTGEMTFQSRTVTYLEYFSGELDIGNGNRRKLNYRLMVDENAVLKAELKQTKARAVELDRQLKLLQAKQKEEAVK